MAVKIIKKWREMGDMEARGQRGGARRKTKGRKARKGKQGREDKKEKTKERGKERKIKGNKKKA